MVTSYMLGFKVVMVYSPAEVVVPLRVAPVFTDFTVTLAPVTTAPVLSVTTPMIVPVSVWPKAQIENSARIASKEINLSVVRFIALSASTEFEGVQYAIAPQQVVHGSGHSWLFCFQQVTDVQEAPLYFLVGERPRLFQIP